MKWVANNDWETTSDFHSFEFLHHEFVQLGLKDFDSISIHIVDTTGRKVGTYYTIPTRLSLKQTKNGKNTHEEAHLSKIKKGILELELVVSQLVKKNLYHTLSIY